MSKKSNLTPEDLEAFAQAVQGTKPLAQRKAMLQKPKAKSVRRKRQLDEDGSIFSASDPVDVVQANDYIAFNQNGVAHKSLRNLREGQYNVDAVLDLHRKTVDEAHKLVDRFLQQCLRDGDKVLLIVHGKGKLDSPPILKNQINHWLRQAKPVLAFCSATPRHGGCGAVYVLLKSHLEEK